MGTKKTYHERKINKICPRCGNKVDDERFVHCSACRESARKNNRENRKYYATIGICTKCGCRPTDGVHLICEQSRERYKEYHKKRKAIRDGLFV